MVIDMNSVKILDANTSDFTWDKKPRKLIGELSDFRLRTFPRDINVTSDVTGKTIAFEVDTELAVENEFWDGIQMVYRPVIPSATDVQVVLIND